VCRGPIGEADTTLLADADTLRENEQMVQNSESRKRSETEVIPPERPVNWREPTIRDAEEALRGDLPPFEPEENPLSRKSVLKLLGVMALLALLLVIEPDRHKCPQCGREKRPDPPATAAMTGNRTDRDVFFPFPFCTPECAREASHSSPGMKALDSYRRSRMEPESRHPPR
jgi:hypothetical protein